MITHATADSRPAEFSDQARNRAPIGPIASPADQDLQQRVRLFLESSNLPGLRHVETEVHGDTVILRGTVRTFYEKQLAVRLSGRVAGVIHVVDSIEAQGYEPSVEPDRFGHGRAARSLNRSA